MSEDENYEINEKTKERMCAHWPDEVCEREGDSEGWPYCDCPKINEMRRVLIEIPVHLPKIPKSSIGGVW
ncbi:MAG: hypothetical protein HQK96_06120 [Nitrospirae bacterium]|nr:hypothetical protein [Nitrospirota bacterium]